MVDLIDQAARSRLMSGIKGKNTAPERRVRSYLHRAGLRFRVHARELPGSPDILLPRWNAAVLVHGCFWHRHPACRFAYTPKTRRSFWLKKFDSNVARDRRNLRQLRRLGWRAFVVWECRTDDRALEKLVARIRFGEP